MRAQSLNELVLDYLRNKIITGELAPGQRLNENELSSTLEVSRHPIREAFRVLQSEKLVYSVPNKGAFVMELSREDRIEVYQAREMIECYAVDLLEQKAVAEFPQLAAAIEKSSHLSVPSNGNLEDYLEFHRAFVTFHVELIEATGNSRLVHFYEAIRLNIARYQLKKLLRPGRIEVDNEEHKGIFNALQQGGYAEAKALLKAHITKSLQDANGAG